MAVELKPATFVKEGAEQDAGEWNDEDRAQIAVLRTTHPELAGWGDLAIGLAWGHYSQDIFAVGWVYWIRERDEVFLAYIYVSQMAPDFDFCSTAYSIRT